MMKRKTQNVRTFGPVATCGNVHLAAAGSNWQGSARLVSFSWPGDGLALAGDFSRLADGVAEDRRLRDNRRGLLASQRAIGFAPVCRGASLHSASHRRGVFRSVGENSAKSASVRMVYLQLRKRPAHRADFSRKRAIGFEPTTSSLGSQDRGLQPTARTVLMSGPFLWLRLVAGLTAGLVAGLFWDGFVHKSVHKNKLHPANSSVGLATT